jgi:hypothetical protein
MSDDPSQMTVSTNQMSGATASDVHGMSAGSSAFGADGASRGTADSASWGDADTQSWSDADSVNESDTESWSDADTVSHSDTESSSTSEGITASTGISRGTSHEQSRSIAHGTNHSTTHGVTQGTSEEEGWSESETVAPFHEYHREEIVSSRSYLTPEEQTLLAIQSMKELPQATFCLKVPNHQALFVRAPWVDEPKVTKKTLESGLQRVHSLPYYTHVEQHHAPVIDVEVCEVKPQRARALPSPAAADEPVFWQESSAVRRGGRQEKS